VKLGSLGVAVAALSFSIYKQGHIVVRIASAAAQFVNLFLQRFVFTPEVIHSSFELFIGSLPRTIAFPFFKRLLDGLSKLSKSIRPITLANLADGHFGRLASDRYFAILFHAIIHSVRP
jgi:hypothetical protein